MYTGESFLERALLARGQGRYNESAFEEMTEDDKRDHDAIIDALTPTMPDQSTAVLVMFNPDGSIAGQWDILPGTVILQ